MGIERAQQSNSQRNKLENMKSLTERSVVEKSCERKIALQRSEEIL